MIRILNQISVGSKKLLCPQIKMFGGLELKGDDETTGAAPAVSAFGFLNAESSSTNDAPASGFSFLNTSAPTTEATPAPLPAMSGFSFLQQETPMMEVMAAPAVEASTVDSGFSFMIPSPEKGYEMEEAPSSSPPPTISAFSFLGTAPSQDETEAVPQPSVGSSIDAPSPVPYDTGLPTGAGVTFGTAKQPAVRKKKTRAQRIGLGAPPAPMPPPSSVPKSAPAPAEVPSPSREIRDAAAEAQRRAEEFMTKKSLEDGQAPQDDIPSTFQDTIAPTPSTDEEVARAKRAAEEAQKMAGRGGFMGTFFKGFGNNSNSSVGKVSNNSGHARKPSPPVDRVAQQQQEMKRAAAERQMQLQRKIEDDDDDIVVVSTSVSGYQPVVSAASEVSSFEPLQPAVEHKIVVKEMAPIPKKKKTAAQAFEEYQALFAQSVHRAVQQVEVVRSQQKMLSEERFVSMAKERLATQQIQQTEAQLQVAVENEDYELADQLGQVIEAHKREKAEVASVLESIAKGLIQLESQKALVVRGVATCFDNLALHIKELQDQETSKDRDTDSETFKQFETISKQLSIEQERLQQDLKHLERDEQLVAEERSELETSISEQSGEYERQRDGVKEKLSSIEEEIAELRRQLDAKSKIAAGLRTEMHGLEDNISRVRVKFSRQLTRLDKKERTIHENRLEWETEKSIFKRQKEAHELQVQSHSEALLEHDALMKNLDDELKWCKEFAGMVSTKLGFMQKDGKSKEADDAQAESNLAHLQADVVKCEAACSEAKIILKAATAAVNNLEAEHSRLVSRVPQLEAEKKAAAAKRDFKAASKASKEIKDATARLKECEEELVGEAADKKKAAQEELSRLNEELEKTRKIAEVEEKVSGIARMQELAKQIKNLVATKTELCGNASSNENTVKGVGAFVLEGQIKALKDEGRELGSKYSGWEELVKDILNDEDDNTETPQSEDDVAEPVPEPADDGLTSEERVAKVRDLVKRIQQAEQHLEAAAEREDYEEAARLQDVFENLQSELESVNLTEEESELAFADEDPAPIESSDPPANEQLVEVAIPDAEAIADESENDSDVQNDSPNKIEPLDDQPDDPPKDAESEPIAPDDDALDNGSKSDVYEATEANDRKAEEDHTAPIEDELVAENEDVL